jgi:hypothetical protein
MTSGILIPWQNQPPLGGIIGAFADEALQS